MLWVFYKKQQWKKSDEKECIAIKSDLPDISLPAALLLSAVWIGLVQEHPTL